MKHKGFTSAAIRRLIFTALIFMSFILQFTVIPRTQLPVPVLILIPLGISVSMFEKEFSGMFFGLLTGALWDLASPVTDGVLALIFTFFFCLAGLLTHYILRNTLLTAILFTLSGSVLYSLFIQLFFSESITAEVFGELLTDTLIPSSLIAVLICIPVYFLVRRISKRFHPEKESS